MKKRIYTINNKILVNSSDENSITKNEILVKTEGDKICLLGRDNKGELTNITSSSLKEEDYKDLEKLVLLKVKHMSPNHTLYINFPTHYPKNQKFVIKGNTSGYNDSPKDSKTVPKFIKVDGITYPISIPENIKVMGLYTLEYKNGEFIFGNLDKGKEYYIVNIPTVIYYNNKEHEPSYTSVYQEEGNCWQCKNYFRNTAFTTTVSKQSLHYEDFLKSLVKSRNIKNTDNYTDLEGFTMLIAGKTNLLPNPAGLSLWNYYFRGEINDSHVIVKRLK